MIGDDRVGLLRTRWPSELAQAEDALERAGISFEIAETFEGEEWELSVAREDAEAAAEALAGLDAG